MKGICEVAFFYGSKNKENMYDDIQFVFNNGNTVCCMPIKNASSLR